MVENAQMATHPRISIVTPSFGQNRFIRQTLRSVAEQGIEAEHLVIDGASTDGTIETLESHHAPGFKWISEPDRGQTDALNKGMGIVTGEILGWLNSDDYYLPGAFKTVLDRFDAPDRPDVVFGYSVHVDESGRLLRESRHDDFSLESLAQIGFDLSQPAMFWRRSWNDQVMPLDESLRFCMDVQLVANLGLHGARFARVPAFLAAFREHGASKTSTLQDVCLRERSEIQAHIRTAAFSAHQPRRTLQIHVARRLHFLARGELLYGLLGGQIPGFSARHAARLAAAWAEPVEHRSIA